MKKNERLLKTIGINPQQSDIDKPFAPKSGPGVLMSQQRTAAELEKAKAEIEVLKNKLLPIEQLVSVPERMRKLKSGEFEDLKANLASNQLVHPIIVRKIAEDKYEIVAGHNRVAAYKELGRTHIEADIKTISDNEVFEAAFYSNFFTSDLSDFEKYEGFKIIQNNTGETQKSIAERAGVTPTLISYLFSFEKLPKDAIGLIKNQPFCLGATQAAKIAKGEESKIIQGLNMLLSGELQTEAQLVAFVLQKNNTKEITEPTTFKIGKKIFAELSSRNDIIAIKLKDQNQVTAIKQIIETAINEFIEKIN
ncbi:ParB/RepB/Spo0J family partition protein [Crenothrix polyspora]|jgi:ParB family chromosome partitioning protein|uniref:Putative ParB family protein n=1 Tax=Crenothrix polyspora TaxID=360316 RepID=A0A1R4H493_9GAMM|nr:ParB/RepB/Spo0J family partition protein [Crenothrix polyspora]SJM91006.1 putative ParB family protein [Crenothrix polyspora]